MGAIAVDGGAEGIRRVQDVGFEGQSERAIVGT